MNRTSSFKDGGRRFESRGFPEDISPQKRSNNQVVTEDLVVDIMIAIFVGKNWRLS
jgi:hypothetical protein